MKLLATPLQRDLLEVLDFQNPFARILVDALVVMIGCLRPLCGAHALLLVVVALVAARRHHSREISTLVFHRGVNVIGSLLALHAALGLLVVLVLARQIVMGTLNLLETLDPLPQEVERGLARDFSTRDPSEWMFLPNHATIDGTGGTWERDLILHAKIDSVHYGEQKQTNFEGSGANVV